MTEFPLEIGPEVLRKGLLRNVPDSDRGVGSGGERGFRVREIPADTTVWSDASEPFFGVVLSGYLRLQSYNRDGRRQIVNIFGRGSMLTPIRPSGTGYELQCCTPVRICVIDRADFERLQRQNPEFAAWVYRSHTEVLEQLRWLSWCVGSLGAFAKFCAFLILATRLFPFRPEGTGGELDLEISRRDVADLLGMSAESISRATRRLIREGLVENLARSRLRLVDLPRIEEVSGLQGAPFPRPGTVEGMQLLREFCGEFEAVNESHPDRSGSATATGDRD